MKYTNKRVEAQEAALARRNAAINQFRLASTDEEVTAARAELDAAKADEMAAEKLPADEFLCGSCGHLEHSLARETLTVVGYTKKDAEGEIVVMETFEPPRHITICPGCGESKSVGDYLHFESFPDDQQLQAFRGKE